METVFGLVSILLALLFPYFLVKAIRDQDEDRSATYMRLSCLAFGVIVFTLIGLH